jgi:DNA-binding transcriptional MerR regulator
VEKGPEAFRTISEVAEDLDLPQHVLRFWETRFAQIKPLKRGGGRRYYRPDDVDLLRGVRHLLYGEGYTIRGVQQILREQGLRHVQSIGRAVEGEAARTAPALADTGHAGVMQARAAPIGRREGVGLIDLLPSFRPSRSLPELPRVVEVPVPPRAAAVSGALETPEIPSFLLRKKQAAAEAQRPPARHPASPDAATAENSPLAPAENGRLSPEAIRLLKATLFELGECRRMLDASRENK